MGWFRPVGGFLLNQLRALLAGDADDGAAHDLQHALAPELGAEVFDQRRQYTRFDLAALEHADGVECVG
jgi:hypothetical protein